MKRFKRKDWKYSIYRNYRNCYFASFREGGGITTGVTNFATMRSNTIWGRRANRCAKATGCSAQDKSVTIGQTYTTELWEQVDSSPMTIVTAVSPVSSLKEIREGESRCSGSGLDKKKDFGLREGESRCSGGVDKKKDFGLLGELKFCSC